jgi:hypothetical protein
VARTIPRSDRRSLAGPPAFMLAALMAGGLVGCSNGAGEAGAETSNSATAPAASTSPRPTGSTTAKPSRGPTSIAEAVETPVPGATPLTASTGLRKTVEYDDTITVKLTKIEGYEVKEEGPGIVKGQRITIFTLTLTNGSSKPLDLNNVKVTATYGDQERQAEPSYFGNLNDFFGTVKPSDSRSAAYGFVLPESGYDDLALRVKFDNEHSTAVFVGSLQ